MNDTAKHVSGAPSEHSPSFLPSVRQATVEDAALLHRLAASTFPLACPPDTTAEAIAAFIATNLSEASFARYLTDPSRDLFVAFVDAAPAGYTMLVNEHPADLDVAAVVTARPAAELSKMYVLPHLHGSGVAATLMGVTVVAARDRGAVVVWLGVNQHNATANRFYEKHGFALVGTKRFLVGGKYEDDFVRALEL